MTAAAPSRIGGFAVFALLLVLLASLLTHFSATVHPRFPNMADSIDSQKAILERRLFVFGDLKLDFASWRSRVMVPYAISAVSRVTGRSFSQAYHVVHWLSAGVALASFALLARRHIQPNHFVAGAAATCFAAVLLPTFLHLYEIPSDFLDAAFFALLTLLALEKRRTLFVITLLIAATNRESAIFAVPLWFLLNGWATARPTFLREAAFCAMAGAVAVGLVLLLRHSFAVIYTTPPPPALKSVAQPTMPLIVPLRQLREFFTHPYWGSPIFFLFGYLALFSAILIGRRQQLTSAVRRLGFAAGAIFVISVPFANLPELRVYIPSLVLATFATLTLWPRSIPQPS